MRTRPQSRRRGVATPGAGGSEPLPGSDGTLTQARRRRCGLALADLPLSPRVKERRDWDNLTTDLVRDVAGRLLLPDSPWPAAQYNRLRAVCMTWSESTDDPRSVCSLDIRFRPRGWTPIRDQVPTSRCRLRHDSGVRTYVELDALSSNYIFAVAEGLLVLRDKKSADVVRVLNPLTGRLTEFPPITEVRAYDGDEQKSSQAIDALKLYFSDRTEFRYFAGIDDSTSPPTLVFCVRNDGPFHVVYAKPGDHHWVSVNLAGYTMSSSIGRLVWKFRPPPGVCMPEKIYVYSFGFCEEGM